MSAGPDSFLVAGDQVMFLPSLGGPALLMMPAITIVISKSKNTASFRGVTVEGDEKNWIIPACPYVNPPFIIPGMGKLSITKLNSAHIAKKVQSDGKNVLLVGSSGTMFEAQFDVIKPAQQPPPLAGDGSPDPVVKYSCKGFFIQGAPSNALKNG